MTFYELIKELDKTEKQILISSYFAGLLENQYIAYKWRWEDEFRPLKSDEEVKIDQQDFTVVDKKVDFKPFTKNKKMHQTAHKIFLAKRDRLLKDYEERRAIKFPDSITPIN